MTDEELKELVAENSRAIREMRAESDQRRHEFREEMHAARAESDRRWQAYQEESRAARAESDRRWQQFQGDMNAARAESDRRWQAFQGERNAARAESDRRWQAFQEELTASRHEFQEELVASRREFDRFMTSIDKRVESIDRKVGRIENKFGDYTEALCRPSLAQALRERFHMSEIAPRVLSFRNGDAIELDMLAHANHEINEVYVAEIKTHLRQDGIDQILEHLRVFPQFFPDHRGKLYGILAALEAPPELQRKVIKEGLYLMLVSGEVLEMRVPVDFQPRAFPTT
jgi:hypothetical protein